MMRDYFFTEKEVAEGLEKGMAVSGVSRKEIFVTSKLWHTDHRPDRVAPALEDTLKELKLKYLDLVRSCKLLSTSVGVARLIPDSPTVMLLTKLHSHQYLIQWVPYLLEPHYLFLFPCIHT